MSSDALIIDIPVSHDGRVEMLHHLVEQSVCVRAHRYGTLLPPIDLTIEPS